MKKTALILLVTTIFTGCMKDGQEKVSTSNSNFELELLFEKDGCKVYRFSDGGHAVYWTNCDGRIESVYQQSNGKSSTEVRVQNETTSKQ